jgi:hypothetical protein
MNTVELLRYVADNLEAGRDEAHGLVKYGAAKDFQGVMLREPRLYSLAPRTRIINGIEVPAPMDKEPKIGEIYWFEHIGREEMADDFRWIGDDIDKRLFSIGIHETAEAAAANCKARYGIK